MILVWMPCFVPVWPLPHHCPVLRENSPLPIALQGFFNDNKACNMGWTNDYHLDINTEQNYWAANVAILPNVMPPCLPILRIWRITVQRLPKWSMDVKVGLPIPPLMFGDILLHPARLFGDCFLWQLMDCFSSLDTIRIYTGQAISGRNCLSAFER